jgi:hypothetical protein
VRDPGHVNMCCGSAAIFHHELDRARICPEAARVRHDRHGTDSAKHLLIFSSLISSLMGMDRPFGERYCFLRVLAPADDRSILMRPSIRYRQPVWGGFLMAIMAIMAGLSTVTVYTGPTARES